MAQLSGKQIALLRKLAAAGVLGEWAGIEPRTVNGLVNRYLVKQEPHPGRGSLWIYRITDKGLNYLASLDTPAGRVTRTPIAHNRVKEM
jgi:hypothetical protein